MLLCLLMWLPSCGTALTQTKYIYVTPPDQYLQARPAPGFTGNTNRDLLTWAMDLRATAQAEEQDKAALRRWAADIKKGNKK